MEKVSVALCTYNGEKYIKEQLDSIICQSRMVDEIIVCDDCSSDNTVQIVTQILKNDFSGEWRVICNNPNKGVIDNFSQAYSLCTGDIIFSSDQDDIWKEDKVLKTLEVMDENTVMAFSDGCLVDGNLNIIMDGTIWRAIGLRYSDINTTVKYSRRVLKSFCATGATMAFRKKLWESIKPVLAPCIPDLYLSILAPVFGDVKAIPEQLVLYRRHGGNVTQVGLNTSSNSKTQTKEYANRFYTEYKELKVITTKLSLYSNDHYQQQIFEALKYHTTSQYIIDNNPRINKLLKLTREFITGRYRKFRGIWKLFVLDVLFIISTKNDLKG